MLLQFESVVNLILARLDENVEVAKGREPHAEDLGVFFEPLDIFILFRDVIIDYFVFIIERVD